MYAGKTDIVSIPAKTENGYAAILKTGYVYWVTDSAWDKARKKTTDKRVSIGKIASEPGKMYPNATYARIFGGLIGAQETEDTGHESSVRSLPKAGDFDSSMAYGPYAAMYAAFSKIGALDALAQAFPAMWRQIFAAAMHASLAGASSAQEFPHWAFDNYAGIAHNMTNSDMEALFAEAGAGREAVRRFFASFHEHFHGIFPQAQSLAAFDTGYHAIRDDDFQDSEGEAETGIPGIHTAMYVDQATDIPVWYEHFGGNIFDKDETPYTDQKAASLGWQDLFLRAGCHSLSGTAVRKLQEQNLAFCLMSPESDDFAKREISLLHDSLRNNPRYLIPEQNIFGCSTEVILGGQTLHACVFYDDDIAKEERDKANSALRYFLEELRTKSRYSDGMARYFQERAILVSRKEAGAGTDGPDFTYAVDSGRIKKIYDEAGFFMMLSNRDLPPAAVIGIERCCSKAENTYQRLRKHFSLSQAYLHNNASNSHASYDGKMFVAFVSMIMSSAFAWYCKDIFQEGRITAPESLLSELRRYKMTKAADGSWMPAYQLSRWQKRIFSSLGITEEMMYTEIRALHI